MKISWEEFKALLAVNSSFTFIENDFEYNMSIYIGQKEYTCCLKKTNEDDALYMIEFEESFKIDGNKKNSQKIESVDVVNNDGQNRAQSITNTASEALGGNTILINRKILSITPTNGTVYWGFSSNVTTITGSPIFKNQTVVFSIGDNVHIFLITSGTVDARIAEAS